MVNTYGKILLLHFIGIFVITQIQIIIIIIALVEKYVTGVLINMLTLKFKENG